MADEEIFGGEVLVSGITPTPNIGYEACALTNLGNETAGSVYINTIGELKIYLPTGKPITVGSSLRACIPFFNKVD